MFKRRIKNKDTYIYMNNVNVNFEQYDILSSYMSALDQMKVCSHTRMCNDIDLYHRVSDMNFNIEQK